MAIDQPTVAVLYGSYARGSADSISDQDILVISDEGVAADSFRDDASTKLSISTYNWQEFRCMADYGSIFLRHLRAEGRTVGGNEPGFEQYGQILRYLPRYAKARENVAAFRQALADVASAISHADSSPEFEAAALATLLRHSAILGCYLINEDDFGRYSAVTRFCSNRGLPPAIAAEFPVLYAYRMSLARSQPWPDGSSYDLVMAWTERTSRVIEEVARVVK
jgi:hypothetical protein